jgi:histidine triad (HIT) family protein
MSETIFSKIVRGEVPCHRVYEDEHVLAFLDITPIAPGHTLLIPKEPARTLDELSDESAAAIGRVLPRICRAVKQVTGSSAYNVLQNNEALAHQSVFHVHFHVIPRPDENQGLGVRWPAQPIDHAEAKALAERLAAAAAKG